MLPDPVPPSPVPGVSTPVSGSAGLTSLLSSLVFPVLFFFFVPQLTKAVMDKDAALQEKLKNI